MTTGKNTATTKTQTSIDRRSFLRLAGVGALGAVGALALAARGAQASTTKPGSTGNSGGWGVGVNNPGTTPTWEPPTFPPAPPSPPLPLPAPSFDDVIARVTGMADDYGLRQRAGRYGRTARAPAA